MHARSATAAFVRDQLRAFAAAAGGGALSYPGGDVFAGRGVVMVGGGLKYMVPLWIAVHQLRHTGAWAAAGAR